MVCCQKTNAIIWGLQTRAVQGNLAVKYGSLKAAVKVFSSLWTAAIGSGKAVQGYKQLVDSCYGCFKKL